jgi:hypothetical protein
MAAQGSQERSRVGRDSPSVDAPGWSLQRAPEKGRFHLWNYRRRRSVRDLARAARQRRPRARSQAGPRQFSFLNFPRCQRDDGVRITATPFWLASANRGRSVVAFLRFPTTTSIREHGRRDIPSRSPAGIEQARTRTARALTADSVSPSRQVASPHAPLRRGRVSAVNGSTCSAGRLNTSCARNVNHEVRRTERLGEMAKTGTPMLLHRLSIVHPLAVTAVTDHHRLFP